MQWRKGLIYPPPDASLNERGKVLWISLSLLLFVTPEIGKWSNEYPYRSKKKLLSAKMSRTFTILCISHLSLLWEIFRHQRICFGWSLPDAPAGFVRREAPSWDTPQKVDFNLHRNWLKKFPQVRQYLAGGYFQPQFEERVCLGHTYHLCRLTFSFIFISTSFASLVVPSLWRTQTNNKMSCLKQARGLCF